MFQANTYTLVRSVPPAVAHPLALPYQEEANSPYSQYKANTQVRIGNLRPTRIQADTKPKFRINNLRLTILSAQPPADRRSPPRSPLPRKSRTSVGSGLTIQGQHSYPD